LLHLGVEPMSELLLWNVARRMWGFG
jgi:hypothetical protein